MLRNLYGRRGLEGPGAGGAGLEASWGTPGAFPGVPSDDAQAAPARRSLAVKEMAVGPFSLVNCFLEQWVTL